MFDRFSGRITHVSTTALKLAHNAPKSEPGNKSLKSTGQAILNYEKVPKILFCRVSKIRFLPLNMEALAMVLIAVVIANVAAIPIMAAAVGPAKDASYFRFYVEKRQWLADARTIGAGIRYMCE